MCWYSRITSTRSSSFFMTTFSASFTNHEIPLPQWHDCSHNASRQILALTDIWLQKHTDLRAHDYAHCTDLWHQPSLAKVTFAWSWRLCEITPLILLVYCSSVCGRPCTIGFSAFEKYIFSCNLIPSWKPRWAFAISKRAYTTIIYLS
jgi:hypothetical protein